MTMNEVIKLLDPEEGHAITRMLLDLGLKDDSNLDDVLPALVTHAQQNQEGGLAVLTISTIRNNSGKFASKLSFVQRCEILALSRKGCTREMLAKMYKIDRRTVTHIYNSQSAHYKNVREEELRLGRENFVKLYITDSVWNAALAYLGNTEDKGNNKAARNKMGIHNLRNAMCDYDHRVVIQWVEADGDKISVSGWYYKDLDGDWPGEWSHCGPGSMKTSTACYYAAREDIADKIN